MYHFETKLKSSDNTYKDIFLRHQNNPILSAKDWPYPVNTVFNPAVTNYQNKIMLLARAEDRRGFSHLAKAVSENGVVNWIIDTKATFEGDPENYPEEAWEVEDPRINTARGTGKMGGDLYGFFRIRTHGFACADKILRKNVTQTC